MRAVRVLVYAPRIVLLSDRRYQYCVLDSASCIGSLDGLFAAQLAVRWPARPQASLIATPYPRSSNG
jgi:hypothetical protein